MSNMKECVEILRHYTTARIPFVVFDTTEMRRALDIMKQVNTELSIPGTYVHTLNKGMYDITSGAVVDEDTTFYGAMAYMSEQMRRKQELTFVLCSASGLDEETAETRQLLNIVDTAVETGGMIIAITTGPIWNQLQRAGMRLTLDFPDEQEMRGIIYNMLDGYRNFQIEWDDNDIKEAAQMLAGVSQIEAENVIADLLANQKILKSDLDSLRFVKDRLFSDISGLERIKVDPRDGEVGGLSGLQAWLNDKKKLQTPAMREQMRQLGLPAPRGILLVGVPGCGKSLSAKAIAANWNLPLYRLDFATVQGSYVGQSERQLREALETAEQVSPCVLWIDEIEKGLSGATGAGDSSGVSTRMVGQFLFWLQECRKYVFVVATANDVSKLPSELLRRGRFDEIFFVDLPNFAERKSILSLHYRRYVKEEISSALLDKLANISDGFTGADLESAMRDAGYYRLKNNGKMMNEEDIVSTVSNIIPLSRTSPEKIEAIRAWGRERAVPASGRPIGGEDMQSRPGRRILSI